MKNLIKKLRGPLIAILISAILFIAWRLLHLPPRDELINIARFYFEQYGLIVLLLSAFAEGLFFLGWYYPGSLVIFLGVIFAGRDLEKVIMAVSCVIIGLLAAYIGNFFIGRYGWYRLFLKFGLRDALAKSEKRLARYGWRAIFMTYWQPNIASLTATAAGTLQLPWKRFFLPSLAAAILWNIFWGVLVYTWGEAALSIIGLKFVLIFLTAWILYLLIFSKEEAQS
jgi:membrane-associated protein